jgi:serine/threonine-protein kinase
VSQTSYERAKAVFLDVLAQPEDERQAYLDGLVAGDTQLADEVRSLLGWHRDDAGARAASTTTMNWTAQQLERRAAASESPPSTATESTDTRTLPNDVLQLACRRIRFVSLAFGCIWAVITLNNNLFLEQMRRFYTFYPHPGNEVAVVAVLVSLGTAYYASKGAANPKRVMHVGAASMVAHCLLVAVLAQWTPPIITPRISWTCVPLLFYPVVVATSPKETLWITLIGASMEPLVFGIQASRGVATEVSLAYVLWCFLPSYICALLAVVPVRIVHGLGQQVQRARELGNYVLEEPLGSGGMGQVFRATHQMLARPAAVKLIKSEVLMESDPNRARVVTERFRREAEATALLRSPHTISLYDFGVTDDGTFFIVMELLDGLDLDSLVRRFGPLEPERAVYLLTQVCASLEEAHTRGLVHRDIKPSNIFTCRMGLATDFVKVLDFGLVKKPPAGEQDTTLTRVNGLWGTPAYLAPEAVDGGDTADHRVDVYALGCVAYWLLTGQQVFEADTPVGVMVKHMSATPVPPSQRSGRPIPLALDAVILACLAKNPADRPATAGELARRLSEVALPRPWTPDRAQAWWQEHVPEPSFIGREWRD